MPKTITVTNMLRASYLADGPMVEMEFAGLNGEKFALRFSPDKLESFVAQARQASHARHQYRTDERGRILSAFMLTAMDLFVVPTVSFRLLYGLLIMEMASGRFDGLAAWTNFATTPRPKLSNENRRKDSSVRCNQPRTFSLPAHGQCRESGSIVDCELLIDVVQMDLDRTIGNIQPVPDLLVRKSF